ncbi:hypothetical protein [Halalkalicoccus jeotgali]|nr:hypothetical protein [Halalkalicoccus jeotgali]
MSARTPESTSLLRMTTLVAIGVFCMPALVRAHGTGADHDVGVAFGAVIAGILGIGIAAGTIVLLTGLSLRPGMLAGFDRVIGIVLILLGVLLAVSAIGEYPLLATAGIVGGGTVAWSISARIGTHHAEVASAALITHRVVEGIVLAAVYLAGSAVGTAGALLIAGHAALETAAIAGLYVATERGSVRALIAIVLLQVGFGIGIVGGTLLALAVSTSLQVTVMAAGAGALLVVGNAEVVEHRNREAAPLRERWRIKR